MNTNDVCKCGEQKQGFIFRGDILTEWWMECPLCNLRIDPLAALKDYEEGRKGGL